MVMFCIKFMDLQCAEESHLVCQCLCVVYVHVSGVHLSMWLLCVLCVCLSIWSSPYFICCVLKTEDLELTRIRF